MTSYVPPWAKTFPILLPRSLFLGSSSGTPKRSSNSIFCTRYWKSAYRVRYRVLPLGLASSSTDRGRAQRHSKESDAWANRAIESSEAKRISHAALTLLSCITQTAAGNERHSTEQQQNNFQPTNYRTVTMDEELTQHMAYHGAAQEATTLSHGESMPAAEDQLNTPPKMRGFKSEIGKLTTVTVVESSPSLLGRGPHPHSRAKRIFLWSLPR